MRPLPKDFARSFFRCFGIQAGWNHRTQLAGGLCYAMIPLLKRIHGGDPEALRASLTRHLEPFNAHPCLAPLAVGALARLELRGEDAATIERSRRALSAPLGAEGDRLVWSGWRPFCLMGAITAASLGLGVGPSILLFLLLYNVGNVGLRAWAFRAGWREGPVAVRHFTDPALRHASRWLAAGAALLAGLASVAAAAAMLGDGATAPGLAVAAAVALVAGAWTRPDWAGRIAPWIGVAALVVLGTRG